MDNDKIVIESDDDMAAQAADNKALKRVLVFCLGKEYYCIDIAQAKEAVVAAKITRVPNSPPFISGIINLRGEIISVINLKSLVGMDEVEKKSAARIIVTDATGPKIGLMVDSVNDSIYIDSAAVQPPLSTLNEKMAAYTIGEIQAPGKILVFLDMVKVLNCREITDLIKGGY